MDALSTKNKQGFTIIEVVLVLAIAALIFLMVFIALPALQRNQRDTQRKNDLGRFAAALTSYQSNNRGKLPPFSATYTSTDFVNAYLKTGGDEFVDPSGDPYDVTVVTADAAPTVDNTIFYRVSAKCDTDGTFQSVSGARKFAVSMKLEGSAAYCQNN